MTHENALVEKNTRGSTTEEIENLLQTLITRLTTSPETETAGRPKTLPSSSLWMAVLVAVLRELTSQRAIWRLLVRGGWWGQPCYDISDQAVSKRLEQEGWHPLACVFAQLSQIVAQWLQPALRTFQERHGTLASFASDVIALDETTLDRASRRLPLLRHFKNGDPGLLPGTLVSLFDVRLQQWKTVHSLPGANDNGRETARQLLATLQKGALILADLGSFAFRWFDDVTTEGFRWVSRCKEGTTVVVLHTYFEEGDTFDRLVWLGADDWKATYAVRQVQFRQGGVLRQYLTTVCHPLILPLPEIARLSARRWDIELAFLTLKRELRLHMMWSSNALVVQAHVWACLILAHVLQAIRMDVALRAEVDAFDVSLPLLFEMMPQWSWDRRDGIEHWVRQGRRLGLIRPSTRLQTQAPPIPSEHLIPLPQGTLLCRQPFYGKPKNPEPAWSEPALPPDPARDRAVAFLLQREAELLAFTRPARPPAAPKPAGKTARPRTTATPPIPDPSIAAPSLACQHPFFAW